MASRRRSATSADPVSTVSRSACQYAEAPAAFNPTVPEDRRVDDSRFFVFFGRSESVTLVMRVLLEDHDVAAAVREVREIVKKRGHRNACWSIGTSSTPSDLVQRLIECGLRPDDRGGNEVHTTAMVLGRGVMLGRSGTANARRVESFEEFVEAAKIDRAAFGIDNGWNEWLENAPSLWERERSGLGPRVYLAFVDGETVGSARAIFDPEAVLLLGGGVLEQSRGRGAYKALVLARWEDARRVGTPSLAVHAGQMSRPILERLGFSQVAEITQLYDPATL
jgi:hypothetical protein